MEPKISIVIATRNSARTLDMTLLSLRLQRGCVPRVLVVDSGSTDGTLSICRRWDAKTIYTPPGNMYRAINLGLEKSDTDWLAYINSDDWVYPESFARLISYGEARKADVVYGDCDYVDGSGRFLFSIAPAKPKQLLSLFRAGIFGFAQQAAIFRKQLYQHLNGFDDSYSYNADSDFYFRAVLAKASFAQLPKPSVACFRLHANQLSKTKLPAIRAENAAIHSKLARVLTFFDRSTVALWRITNIPHYAIRILRLFLLTGRFRRLRSEEAGLSSE